ncbi:MAG: serine hydrolase [Thermoanaerobaculia bacterium]
MLREPASLLFLLSLLLVPLTMLVPRAPVHAQEVDLDRLDARIESERTASSIPGLAIAIVKDDRVVLAKGYGLQSAEGTEPVDAHTLFAIGSTTKAFTATALGPPRGAIRRQRAPRFTLWH